MRKFIHSNFELDLSTFKITDTSENPWFTGTYFAKYSYPFDLPLTAENDIAFGFISHYNSVNAETIFDGLYVHGDKIEKAVLEIEECETSLSVTIRYGLDDFPNFDKKLSELPLAIIDVPNIYVHAGEVISQTWPVVNYNFPQIHTDKFDPESSDQWAFFEKIINNYKNGAFLINEVGADDITYNRNIIQPAPYLLHIVKTGINAAGYTLHGDILQDEDVKKTLVFTDTEYYTEVSQDGASLMVAATDYDSIEYVEDGSWAITINKTVQISMPGKYRIVGTGTMNTFVDTPVTYVRIKYRDTELTYYEWYTGVPGEMSLNFDTVFETAADVDEHYLTFEMYSRYIAEDMMFDVNINPIRLHDEEGNAIPTIQNLNKVDITRAVPDMTFGDFMKFVLTAWHLDLEPKGSEIWINYVKTELVTRPIVDLSAHEVKYPKRKFNKGKSYLLKYNDVESEEYKYAQVFQNKEGNMTADFKTDDKTQEVVINALPLPLATRNGLQTAHAFTSDKNKPLLIMYDGLVNGVNRSLDPANLLIPYLHQKHYKSWFASTIDSSSFTWTLYADYFKLMDLTGKSRVHAYGNLLITKSLQKTDLGNDIFEVEIEAELLK